MRTSFFSWSLLTLALAGSCLADTPAAVAVQAAAPAQAPAAAPTSARDAITRSLPYMEKEGVAWMEKRKCVSCHQVPSLIWSFNALQHRGFTVDTAKLSQWNEWSLKGAFGGNFVYKLPEKALADLVKNGAKQEDADKLKAMKDREFLKDTDFWQAVKEQLGAEMDPTLKAQILKVATKPGVAPGSAENFGALYGVMLHTGVVDAVKTPDAARTAFLEALVRNQQKDGLWSSSGQFMGMNRSKEEATAVNSAWILLAFTYIDSLPETVTAARDRALAALAKTPPGVSTESTLVRLMLANRSGDAKQEAELLDKLLKLQRPDGGWAFRGENPNSDVLTTGQVLYGLRTVGRKNTDEPLQRAVHYLLQGQQADGSWSVPWVNFNVENNKDHTDGSKVFSYWGSGWAIVGLLQTLEG